MLSLMCYNTVVYQFMADRNRNNRLFFPPIYTGEGVGVGWAWGGGGDRTKGTISTSNNEGGMFCGKNKSKRMYVCICVWY